MPNGGSLWVQPPYMMPQQIPSSFPSLDGNVHTITPNMVPQMGQLTAQFNALHLAPPAAAMSVSNFVCFLFVEASFPFHFRFFLLVGVVYFHFFFKVNLEQFEKLFIKLIFPTSQNICFNFFCFIFIFTEFNFLDNSSTNCSNLINKSFDWFIYSLEI